MKSFWPFGVIPLSKKELNELLEKAEKSDEYYRAMREFQERNSNQAHMIRELKKELKAIKNVIIETDTKIEELESKFPNSKKTQWMITEHLGSVEVAYRKIKKVLEDEGY